MRPKNSAMPLLRIAFLVGALALLLVPTHAQAAEKVFRNSTPIAISVGAANPYPSSIWASGARGPVWDVEVELTGLTHLTPSQLELLLVAPDGTHIPLMSDACFDGDFVNKTLIIKSASLFVPEMPFKTACNGTYYRATNHDDGSSTSCPAHPQPRQSKRSSTPCMAGAELRMAALRLQRPDLRRQPDRRRLVAQALDGSGRDVHPELRDVGTV